MRWTVAFTWQHTQSTVNGKQAAMQAAFCVDDMRAHLVEMLECGTATIFPRETNVALVVDENTFT